MKLKFFILNKSFGCDYPHLVFTHQQQQQQQLFCSDSKQNKRTLNNKMESGTRPALGQEAAEIGFQLI